MDAWTSCADRDRDWSMCVSHTAPGRWRVRGHTTTTTSSGAWTLRARAVFASFARVVDDVVEGGAFARDVASRAPR